MNLHFLIIAPQNDFANLNRSLLVLGAAQGLERLVILLKHQMR